MLRPMGEGLRLLTQPARLDFGELESLLRCGLGVKIVPCRWFDPPSLPQRLFELKQFGLGLEQVKPRVI